MTADPRRVKELFVAALELPDPQARQAFLDRECAADTDLRQRLEALLKAHENPASVLERPLAAVEPPVMSSAQESPAGPEPGETGYYHDPGEYVGSIIVGKYKLLEALGQGGMGDVFMAQQTAPVKRLVALKLIKPGMDSRQVLARFEVERQALALMDHPNIAKVLDAGATESGRPFFVMELVKGVPITRFCDERQLSPRERLELFIPVCQAIQHAHQKGVIHRDIKPSNVLVALYDDRPVPKVIDFGVAKAAGSQLTDASLVTGFGAIVGTPEYMSPEQAQLNQLDIDTRSDVYALGVLLYELLTGTTPIDRKRLGQHALLEILRVIREEEPPRPSARLSTCETLASVAATRRTEPAKLARLMRGELDWIVMKCLEKERSRRYETANALARDLERYLHDEVIEARPPSAGYRLRKFVQKHRTGFAMAATVVLLLLAGAAVSAWLAVLARQAESEAAQALHEAEESREEAVEQRRQADEQRQRAERQAASAAMDMDLKYCEDSEIALGVLRLAETLRSMPEHAKELRECAALNILAWGQRFRPAWTLDHDGFAVTEALLSPDGKSVLSYGRDGTARLWDSVTGKQRAILGQPPQRLERDSSGLIQFSKDGSIALTSYGKRPGRVFRSHVFGGDGIARLWDIATGQLRAATSPCSGTIYYIGLSQNNSLLVTGSAPSPATSREYSRGKDDGYTVSFWNARTGQLIRKLHLRYVEFFGYSSGIDVSPDGKSVLISDGSYSDVYFLEENCPPKRLRGAYARFSPSGASVVSNSRQVVYWWNPTDWQLHHTIDLTRQIEQGHYLNGVDCITDDVLLVTSAYGAGFGGSGRILVRNLPKLIEKGLRPSGLAGKESGVEVSRNGHLIVIGTQYVYDAHNGQQLFLPHGRKFHPELRQLSDDGRFTSLLESSVVDLAADKEIDLGGWYEGSGGHFLKNLDTWVFRDSGQRIAVLRKSDASLDAEILRKWCQVVTRGKLDENGRFSKFDEPTWETERVELARLLDANPKAQSLRSAVIDPMYWLRQEIKDKDDPSALPLVDRLVAAEPTWQHYSQRAAIHAKLEHWDLAIQDELEAARLAGERYWVKGSSFADWQVGARSVQVPGRPREQYERALRWVEARTRAGVDDEQRSFLGEYLPRRTTIAGLALFRLGRYAEALAALQKSDVPMYSGAAGMLMSRWNLLTVVPFFRDNFRPEDIMLKEFSFDPVDLLVRAMCHHRLGRPKEANACLNQARGILPKNAEAINLDQRPFLSEAESLIEGKPRP